MKKVINGSMYNTDSAKEMGFDSHGISSDLGWWCETLYRTKSGKFFLHGEGGPQTRYASHPTQNTWGYGEKILPVSEETAHEWAEEHLDGDTVERIFGATEEKTTRISVFLPADLVEKMDALGDEKHSSRAEIIAAALRKYL